MIRVDLHMHTTRSDGRHSLQEVMDRCSAGRLDVVAVTDHDVATEPAEWEVEGRKVRRIGASEVTANWRGGEIHLLAYFPAGIPDAFARFCDDQCARRTLRYEAARHALGWSGLPNAADLAARGVIAPTRHHLARAMVDGQHVRDLRSAFAHLGRGLVPRFDRTAKEALSAIAEAGGISCWAHPPLNLARDGLAELVGWGLRAIELVRPANTSRDRYALRKLASRHDLLFSGGSDWHGWHDAPLGLFHATEADVGPLLAELA